MIRRSRRPTSPERSRPAAAAATCAADGRVPRVDHEAPPVRLGGHDPAARAHGAGHLGDRRGGVVQVLEHPLDAGAVDAVVGEAERRRVRAAELHGGVPGGGGTAAGLGDHLLAGVDPDRPAARLDPARQGQDVLAGPAAHVEQDRAGTRVERGDRPLLPAGDRAEAAHQVEQVAVGARLAGVVDVGEAPEVGPLASRRR